MIDLDEYDEQKLRDEITRRENARRNGDCDYCGRDGSTTPCKFPLRHEKAVVFWQRAEKRKQGIY